MNDIGANQNLDGIAIIGMAGRFPRGRNVREFWRNIRDGVECSSRFATEELDVGDSSAPAGGVSITSPQKKGHSHVEGGIGSRDGHGRTFDIDALGTDFASGSAVALLNRLEDEVADLNHIYAVIKGFAVNNDGSATVGYALPASKARPTRMRPLRLWILASCGIPFSWVAALLPTVGNWRATTLNPRSSHLQTVTPNGSLTAYTQEEPRWLCSSGVRVVRPG